MGHEVADEAPSAVDEAWVRAATAEMMAMAAEHGVEYDGWEAEAAPPLLP